MGEQIIASGPDFWGNLVGLDEPQDTTKPPPDPVERRKKAEADAAAQREELKRRREQYGYQSTSHTGQGMSGLTYTAGA